MEPMMPAPGTRELEDLAMELATKGSALAATMHAVVRQSIGDLVRSMNCYYSNLIEGHCNPPGNPEQLLVENHAAISNRRGGTPPMPVWGRSLLYFQSHLVANS
jgi:hypothetical protein